MAKVVGSFAASHAPNIARAWDNLSDDTREWLTTRYGELGDRVKALEPDILVFHSNDHWINFFLDNRDGGPHIYSRYLMNFLNLKLLMFLLDLQNQF